MTRKDILEAARSCVCGERDREYGGPEDSFGLIAALWEAYIARHCASEAGVCILPEDVAALMALLKIARIATCPHGKGKVDNWVDLAGYAACGGQLQTGGSAAERDGEEDGGTAEQSGAQNGPSRTPAPTGVRQSDTASSGQFVNRPYDGEAARSCEDDGRSAE